MVVTRSPNRHQAPMDLLNPNSTHSEKKKRGHRRIKSRERIAKIADMGESYSESYGKYIDCVIDIRMNKVRKKETIEQMHGRSTRS